MTEDEKVFGKGVWVYCKSHVAPHTTGWCTCRAKDKIQLAATDREAAYKEARALGFRIYGE